MIDPSKYENNRAFELSSDMQQDILYILNNLYQKYMDCATRRYNLRAEMYLEKTSYIREFLKDLGIYAEIGWAGHRNEYFFPNVNDAEAELDWIMQSSD